MMFWTWFNQEAVPQLAMRAVSFRKIFEYLDSLEPSKPLVIVETGCLRTPNNWGGDGQSTLLFDQYLKFRPAGGSCIAMDIDPAATAACKSIVTSNVQILTGDSVSLLRDVADSLRSREFKIDLLYLDSFDLDWENVTPSAVHHLKELVSIYECLTPLSLVVVDDAPMDLVFTRTESGDIHPLRQPSITGKGKFVAEYAAQVGARIIFSHYQSAWIGFR